ncbi:MAG: sigma-70 family RNA polymerase sigma factor [Planctomycetota bacterium]
MSDHRDDATLIRDYLRGDREALGGLYDRHAPAVFGYLRKRFGPEEAEDVLQETFLQAADALRRYTHRDRLRPWLLTLARSRALDRVRKRARLREGPWGEDKEEAVPRREPSPLEREVGRETGRKIESAVAGLPLHQREIFLMREEAGLSFREISLALGIPLNTALSHMRRALIALRVALADLEETLD